MLDESTFCGDCGDAIHVGDWPFCGGVKGKHVHMDRFGDDPIEGYIDDNLQHDPVEITTRGQRRALMSKLGIEYRPKKKRKALFFDMRG